MPRQTLGRVYNWPGFKPAWDGATLHNLIMRMVTRETGWEGIGRVRCSGREKTVCISAFCTKNHHFTETGSGHTQGKHSKRDAFAYSTHDVNADLCAAKNYHETMLAHGADSVLALVPEVREAFFWRYVVLNTLNTLNTGCLPRQARDKRGGTSF